MKFFIDTADVNEIREAIGMGLVDGVTTNPSLVAKTGRKYDEVIKDIVGLVKGPISLEVMSTDYEGMMREAEELVTKGEQVVIKCPLTPAGLKATRTLADRGHRVNVTLCFTGTQALLAAKAGAAYISPFIGRLDDVSNEGMQVIMLASLRKRGNPSVSPVAGTGRRHAFGRHPSPGLSRSHLSGTLIPHVPAPRGDAAC